MRRPCSAFIFFVLLVFGVSLAVPAEDVPETSYDESETLPYEGTPLFSIAAPLVASRTTQAAPGSLQPGFGNPFLFAPACVCDADARDTRISLALICILLC